VHGAVDAPAVGADGVIRCEVLTGERGERCGAILVRQVPMHPERDDEADLFLVRGVDGPLEGAVISRAQLLGGEFVATDAQGHVVHLVATGELEQLDDGRIAEVFRPA